MRGFAAIGLADPKHVENVGGVMRAAFCFGAGLVVVGGKRAPITGCADVFKTWRHVPVLRLDDVMDGLPFDCVPIAVDLVAGATPLPRYKHPQRAFYVFGGEDQTLGKRVLGRCRDAIMVETRQCMNLAAAVNVVLYDRHAKMGAS